MIKLSVIIPMYNAEDNIERCVMSIVSQDLYPDQFEIIIVNEGSTDKSLDIVMQLAERYSNIRIISQLTKGINHAQEMGVKHARGQYIHVVKPDEYLSENIYGKLHRIISDNKLDILTFNKIEENEVLSLPKSISKGRLNLNEILDGIKYIEKFNYYNTVWWDIIRKELLISSSFYFTKGFYLNDGLIELFFVLDRKSNTTRTKINDKRVKKSESINKGKRSGISVFNLKSKEVIPVQKKQN